MIRKVLVTGQYAYPNEDERQHKSHKEPDTYYSDKPSCHILLINLLHTRLLLPKAILRNVSWHPGFKVSKIYGGHRAHEEA